MRYEKRCYFNDIPVRCMRTRRVMSATTRAWWLRMRPVCFRNVSCQSTAQTVSVAIHSSELKYDFQNVYQPRRPGQVMRQKFEGTSDTVASPVDRH